MNPKAPKLTKEGYFTVPSLKRLQRFDDAQLQVLLNELLAPCVGPTGMRNEECSVFPQNKFPLTYVIFGMGPSVKPYGKCHASVNTRSQTLIDYCLLDQWRAQHLPHSHNRHVSSQWGLHHWSGGPFF